MGTLKPSMRSTIVRSKVRLLSSAASMVICGCRLWNNGLKILHDSQMLVIFLCLIPWGVESYKHGSPSKSQARMKKKFHWIFWTWTRQNIFSHSLSFSPIERSVVITLLIAVLFIFLVTLKVFGCWRGSFVHLILKKETPSWILQLIYFPLFLEQVLENMFTSAGGQDVKVCVIYLLLGVNGQLSYFLVYMFLIAIFFFFFF